MFCEAEELTQDSLTADLCIKIQIWYVVPEC
jgi:hypothetical protein